MPNFSQVLDFIIDFFFPQFCENCDKLLSSNIELFFCNNCYNQIFNNKIISEKKCYICGKIFISKSLILPDKNIICRDCRKEKPYFNLARHLFVYKDKIKKIIRDYKYSNRIELSDIFANILSDFLLDKNNNFIDLKDIDFIVNVPEYKLKLSSREFDHIKLICEKLSKKLQKSFLVDLLIKTKATKQQAGLPRKQRLINLLNVFAFNEKKYLDIDLNNRVILIIDDVFSTGATLNEVSKVIKNKFKNCKIICLTIARGI